MDADRHACGRRPTGEFVLVDTAGIRRQAHFDDQAEFYATMRALQALERADVACLVVDATQGFQRQEARLAEHALDAGLLGAADLQQVGPGRGARARRGSG